MHYSSQVRQTMFLNLIFDLMHFAHPICHFQEMLLSPLLRYFDIFQILDRHYFAPRANTLEDLYRYVLLCFNFRVFIMQ